MCRGDRHRDGPGRARRLLVVELPQSAAAGPGRAAEPQ
jgi:hypothetical protein